MYEKFRKVVVEYWVLTLVKMQSQPKSFNLRLSLDNSYDHISYPYSEIETKRKQLNKNIIHK